MHNSWTVAGIFLCLVALATSGSSSMTATLLDRTSLRRGSEGEKGQCHVPAESQSNLLSMGMSMVARLRGGGKGVLSVKNKEEFDNAIKGAEMAVCEFYASWCGPCHKISPVFEQLSYNNTDILFLKVDVDQMEDVATACGISCMPTFQSYLNGKNLREFSGAEEASASQRKAKSFYGMGWDGMGRVLAVVFVGANFFWIWELLQVSIRRYFAFRMLSNLRDSLTRQSASSEDKLANSLVELRKSHRLVNASALPVAAVPVPAT